MTAFPAYPIRRYPHRSLPTIMWRRQWYCDSWRRLLQMTWDGCDHYDRHRTWRLA